MNRQPGFPLRGGNWTNGANAGLGALNLNNPRSNSNSNNGFRPALDNARSSYPKGCCQCNFEKDAATPAIAETDTAPADASAVCIFEKIYQFDNLYSAAYSCRKGKTRAHSTLGFFDNLEENLIDIQNRLIWNMYEARPYRHFYVFEPKRRLISAPHFMDRVLHRAIYNVVEPMFDRVYIDDSYACRINKGTHKGADRAQSFISKIERSYGKAYALKADISRYFSSINHGILKQLLARRIPCPRTMVLLCDIIDGSPTETLGIGIPLGNLTSQIFANVYLHELDHYIKHTLRIKHYVRYMDDFVVIHHDKNQLHQWRADIERFLLHHLHLKTNAKTQVFPIANHKGRSLDFLGYRIYSSHRLLRKCSVKRIKTTLKACRKRYAKGDMSLADINQKIQSWLGHASHANTHNLKRALFKTPFRRNHV